MSDTALYLLVVDYPGHGLAIPQTTIPSDATFEKVVTDIVDAQFEHVRAVIRVDPVAKTSSYVTLDVAKAVAERVRMRGYQPSDPVRAFLDRYDIPYPLDPVEYVDEHDRAA